MPKTLYQTINWQAPWYQTLAIPPLGAENFTQVKDWLNASLVTPIFNYRSHAIHFVSQDDLPPNTAYETFIAQTGNVPTRDNFHDLLGGMIWLNFPKTKAVFNQLHQQNIEQVGVQSQRSLIRNILTLFDENGGVVVSSDRSLLQDLQTFDWQTALWEKRNNWQSQLTQFFPVGHALLEKLITPRPNITAHVILLTAEQTWFEQSIDQQRQGLDNFLSQFFIKLASQTQLNSKMFQPLPVMGIPDFCEQQFATFYQDTTIFREPRHAPPSTIYTLTGHQTVTH